MGASRTSIVLIGLRRSGKTSLGRALAAATGRAFLDTDELLCARTGRSAAEWLLSEGEAALREQEGALLRALVAEIAQRTEPIVLATGGGSVLAPDAARLLAQLGRVIWLDISAATAVARAESADDAIERPLLAGRTVAEEAVLLHAQRSPIYEALARNRIDASADLAASGLQLLKLASAIPV